MYYSAVITDEDYKGLNPVSFGHEDCPSSHSYGPAVRMYWLIHYVVSGCGIFEINGIRYSVSAGSMFVIPPYVTTYYEADAVDPWVYLWVGFTCQGELPAVLKDVIECPAAQPIFQAMKYCENQENGRSAFLCAKLWELFALLLKNERTTVDCIEQSLDYIHSEYMTGITVGQIAQRLNLDRSYFSILFKRKTGMSPGKYLMNYRMRVAASLLLESGSSVSVTANSVGYADSYIFSKMFKRHYGLSPREFVKQKTEQNTEHL